MNIFHPPGHEGYNAEHFERTERFRKLSSKTRGCRNPQCTLEEVHVMVGTACRSLEDLQ